MLEKDYSAEEISTEIRELISCIDDFVCTKNEFIDNLRKVYLNVSSSN